MCLEVWSFRFGILCHHEKFGEFGFLLEPCSFWELVLSHSLFHTLTILEWDKSLSICIFIYLLLFGFCLVHLLNLWSFMCWIGSLIQFGHRLSCHTLVCAISVYLVFLLKLYLLFGSWKLYACIFTICLYYGMLAFFDPIYRGNSTKSHRLSCAWNSISYQYAHIYVESLLCIVVALTTLDPISLGTILYLNVF